MSVKLPTIDVSGDLPAGCTYSENDWHILASFWYPVYFWADLLEKPVGVQLLDQKIVLFRTSDGIVAAKDYCPHRGSALSGGRVDNDNIVCPYHGLSFNSTGKCTAIPSAGPDAEIPANLGIETYQTQVRYGLIWVCMKDNPLNPIPEYKELEDPALQKTKMTTVWNVGAGRHLENFADTAHFPWIHEGTFADTSTKHVEPYKVEQTETGLFYHIMTSQRDGEATLAGGGRDIAEVPSDYTIDYPYNIHLKLYFPRGNESIIDMMCPISAEQVRIFMIKTRDHDLSDSADEWYDYQVAVNEEDRRYVEAQQPRELPIELGREFHLASDGISIAYRRGWRAYGLQGPKKSPGGR